MKSINTIETEEFDEVTNKTILKSSLVYSSNSSKECEVNDSKNFKEINQITYIRGKPLYLQILDCIKNSNGIYSNDISTKFKLKQKVCLNLLYKMKENDSRIKCKTVAEGKVIKSIFYMDITNNMNDNKINIQSNLQNNISLDARKSYNSTSLYNVNQIKNDNHHFYHHDGTITWQNQNPDFSHSDSNYYNNSLKHESLQSDKNTLKTPISSLQSINNFDNRSNICFSDNDISMRCNLDCKINHNLDYFKNEAQSNVYVFNQSKEMYNNNNCMSELASSTVEASNDKILKETIITNEFINDNLNSKKEYISSIQNKASQIEDVKFPYNISANEREISNTTVSPPKYIVRADKLRVLKEMVDAEGFFFITSEKRREFAFRINSSYIPDNKNMKKLALEAKLQVIKIINPRNGNVRYVIASADLSQESPVFQKMYAEKLDNLYNSYENVLYDEKIGNFDNKKIKNTVKNKIDYIDKFDEGLHLTFVRYHKFISIDNGYIYNSEERFLYFLRIIYQKLQNDRLVFDNEFLQSLSIGHLFRLHPFPFYPKIRTLKFKNHFEKTIVENDYLPEDENEFLDYNKNFKQLIDENYFNFEISNTKKHFDLTNFEDYMKTMKNLGICCVEKIEKKINNNIDSASSNEFSDLQKGPHDKQTYFHTRNFANTFNNDKNTDANSEKPRKKLKMSKTELLIYKYNENNKKDIKISYVLYNFINEESVYEITTKSKYFTIKNKIKKQNDFYISYKERLDFYYHVREFDRDNFVDLLKDYIYNNYSGETFFALKYRLYNFIDKQKKILKNKEKQEIQKQLDIEDYQGNSKFEKKTVVKDSIDQEKVQSNGFSSENHIERTPIKNNTEKTPQIHGKCVLDTFMEGKLGSKIRQIYANIKNQILIHNINNLNDLDHFNKFDLKRIINKLRSENVIGMSKGSYKIKIDDKIVNALKKYEINQFFGIPYIKIHKWNLDQSYPLFSDNNQCFFDDFCGIDNNQKQDNNICEEDFRMKNINFFNDDDKNNNFSNYLDIGARVLFNILLVNGSMTFKKIEKKVGFLNTDDLNVIAILYPNIFDVNLISGNSIMALKENNYNY
ncbi:hypothetical protein EDEG_02651 [Edhazardia aedis USNM 41457]|uniref:Uncharacterized protein n=1 Tax=Edhazardia aedis (strain USNM 41457) TaxID=1003232 RepID=J9D586_EDHAE|nr:hypothetical protein EDEG_02651 [Edhazardia aedis USNM 41457]|eukprot:EJW02966.1 hypothetical protein EDEG_02651 [Edhazardia aedis USNM 41457]